VRRAIGFCWAVKNVKFGEASEHATPFKKTRNVGSEFVPHCRDGKSMRKVK